jgi:hypothetical protein
MTQMGEGAAEIKGFFDIRLHAIWVIKNHHQQNDKSGED